MNLLGFKNEMFENTQSCLSSPRNDSAKISAISRNRSSSQRFSLITDHEVSFPIYLSVWFVEIAFIETEIRDERNWSPCPLQSRPNNHPTK